MSRGNETYFVFTFLLHAFHVIMTTAFPVYERMRTDVDSHGIHQHTKTGDT